MKRRSPATSATTPRPHGRLHRLPNCAELYENAPGHHAEGPHEDDRQPEVPQGVGLQAGVRRET